MRILRLTAHSRNKVLAEAEKTLTSGGVVIVPTDTVYGIVGNARNEKAVDKIFAMKRRSQDKALPIFVKDIRAAARYVHLSSSERHFLRWVWPGAVTVVLKKKKGMLPAKLTCGRRSVGIRVPDSQFILQVLRRLSFPLAQTSVNISGRPAARTFEEVRSFVSRFKPMPNLAIDGGTVTGISSTVVRVRRGKLVVLRKSAVELK